MKFKQKLIEHLLSIILVSAILIWFLILTIQNKNSQQTITDERIQPYLELDFIDFDNSFDRALLIDALYIFEPEQRSSHESLIRAIDTYRKTNLIEGLEEAHLKEQLTSEKWQQLLLMYVKFILIYCFVMILTYYGVQTFGTMRFVRKQQNHPSHLLRFFQQLFRIPQYRRFRGYLKYYLHMFLHLMKAIVIALVYLVLFSPAYVIAYSLKTQINTDTVLFMIILAVISNGLLITYTNKFYTFLVTESRRGYVQTAIVKNLNNSYVYNKQTGISNLSIFGLRKQFPNHVLQHIFINARYQYLQTIKEQASFLISGLIIIEMALNIHGHFTYELLKQILYKNYDIVIVIVLGIFYIVKFTEIFADWLSNKEALKYENVEMIHT